MLNFFIKKKITVYSIMTEINCVKLYIQMNLTTPKDVTRADLPSL